MESMEEVEVEVEVKADLKEEPGIAQKARVVPEVGVEVEAKVGIVRRVFQKKRLKLKLKIILN